MENVALPAKGVWLRENTEIVLLFVLSAVFVYFTPPILSRIYFIIILLSAILSKKPYFWIAFVFILLNRPAGFFSGWTADDLQRIPYYSLGTGISISFFDLFLFFYFIKGFFAPKRDVFFKSGVQVLAFYAIILYFVSLSFGMSILSYIQLGRHFVLPFLFFLIIHKLIKNSNEFEKLLKIIFPFILLALIGQIHGIYFGKYLTTYFKSGSDVIASTGIAMAEVTDGISRTFDSEFLVFLTFIIAGFHLIYNSNKYSPIWLASILFMDFIICFSSATRGSFISFVLILVNLIYFLSKSSLLNVRNLFSFIALLAVILIGLNFINKSEVLSRQLNSAADRLSSVGVYFGQTDLRSSESGNKRLSERIPKLMKQVKESPIVGYGFSDKANLHADGHVGFHNQLLEGGILELLVFAYFFFNIISKVRTLTTGFRMANKKNALRFMAYALIALLVVHGTSSQHFGYILGFQSVERWFMFSIFFSGINIYYQELKAEMELNNSSNSFKKAGKISIPKMRVRNS